MLKLYIAVAVGVGIWCQSLITFCPNVKAFCVRHPRGSDSQTQVGGTIPSRSESEHSREQSEDIVSHGRRREPNNGAPIPDHPSKRIKVTVVNNRFIESGVTRNLTNDIKGILTKAWPRWHAVPKQSKDLLWRTSS
ncbi:hypothetical protein Salat_0667500 [Sesamum alatum]|uniref:Uncharacterized protein n=1 Tax=Sesamum alatum TaxID=300844 RepID=A0AAE1YSU0_9LAMI|nr:hypothetical protein Salat_0667500 [Sesamum alatum]